MKTVGVFLCRQLYIQARMRGKWTRLVRPTIQFFLVAFSLYVGYTRVSDFKHHWSDVLVGLLQGALIAVLTVSPTLAYTLSPHTHTRVTSFTPLLVLSKVRYVSDFFKQRPPRCVRSDPSENEHLERKPNPQPPDGQQRGNHYSYPGAV